MGGWKVHALVISWKVKVGQWTADKSGEGVKAR